VYDYTLPGLPHKARFPFSFVRQEKSVYTGMYANTIGMGISKSIFGYSRWFTYLIVGEHHPQTSNPQTGGKETGREENHQPQFHAVLPKNCCSLDLPRIADRSGGDGGI
jgi:hypothetical protein